MRTFWIILKFELENYFKNKTFIISTILICILSIGIMFAPKVIDSFDKKDSGSELEEVKPEDMEKMALYDPNKIVNLDDLLMEFGSGVEFVISEDLDSLKKGIEDETYAAGYAVNSLSDFDYYVLNKGMMDSNAEIFAGYMRLAVKEDYCERNNLDIEEFLSVEYAEIATNEYVLGKDANTNYWYSYVLVVLVFMIIIIYGIQIATSVTNEKSNRSIEILVTTTSSIGLLFGKVIAGVISTIFQVGVIGIALFGSYQFNKDQWGGMAASFLDIPADVMVVFAIFGIGGFLLYAFIYGALGALVSKIEDLNKTAGAAQMIITLVYFVVLINLTNVDGIIVKVASYLPISSYSAMFTRVAMGQVEIWEIVVSAVILYASVIVTGIIAGKIFRNSTLRYGNPIKISTALKSLRKDG